MNEATERALVRRVNRKLKTQPDRLQIRACRPRAKWFGELGRFYAVDTTNLVTAKHIDLTQWASGLGLFTP